MSYYSPIVLKILKNWKKLSIKKKDIKKLRLNRKIKKETLNYDLAEQYAPITKLQKDIKKGQEENIQAIEDQSKILKSLSTPAIEDEDEDDLDSNDTSFYTKSIEDEENSNIKSIDSEISDKLSALLNSDNTYTNFKFKKHWFK